MIPPDIIPPEWTRAADAAERETEARYARARQLAPLAAELPSSRQSDRKRGPNMTRADTCANCGRAPVAVDVIEASTGERSAVCMTCYLAAYSDVALDWQTSPEHRGLQGVAFPEAATQPEQGALL